jgi:LysR family transcriptional regulator, glycine cleavage system transcriptional activator
MTDPPNRPAKKARGHYKPKGAPPAKEVLAHKTLGAHPTRMPPLGTLRAFESVARLQSVQLAAMELHVTPSAVSQQVKALEADLGVKLINRYGNTLSLTEQAIRGRDQLSAGLRLLQQGVERIRMRPQMRRLRLTVEPAFAANWLIRRLPSYRALPGAQDVLLDPSKEVVDIARGEADLGIRFGNGRYPGLEGINLFEDEIFPVCSPGYLRLNPIKNLEDLKNHHLLRIDWRASARWPDWTEWLAAAGVIDEDDTVEAERRGTVIRDSSLLLRAALEGQGIALGQGSLVADLIKEKKLVAPVAGRMKTGFGYYLVYPLGADQRPEIKVFRDWVVQEAKKA